MIFTVAVQQSLLRFAAFVAVQQSLSRFAAFEAVQQSLSRFAAFEAVQQSLSRFAAFVTGYLSPLYCITARLPGGSAYESGRAP